MAWVRFHEEITQGAKRGIKRALRFIYMELSLEAHKSKTRGKILLAKGMNDLDAVHDAIGGDRREIAAALREFTGGNDPSLVFETLGTGESYLIVIHWHKWNPNADLSTPRVKRHRDANGQSVCPEELQALTDSGNGDQTVLPIVPETDDPVFRNGGEGVPRARARASNSPSLSSGSSSSGSTLQDGRQTASIGWVPATPAPDDIALTDELRDYCVMAGAPEPTRDHVLAFLANARSKAQVWPDWVERFKWWMIEEKKRVAKDRDRARPGSIPNGPAPRPRAVLPELK